MINIKRQPVKSGVLFVLIFILGTVLSAAISVRTAIIATEESVIMRVPAVSTIYFDYVNAATEMDVPLWDPSVRRFDNQLTIHEISAVGQLPYIRAYDFYLRTAFFSRDLKWAPFQVDESRLRGISLANLEQAIYGFSRSLGIPTEMLMGRGVNNPEITEIEAGLLSLASGRTFYPEEIENGAMVAVVSENFAVYNNLYIGATISLHSAVHDSIKMNNDLTLWLDDSVMIHHEILEFEIIGIFNVEHEVNYENYQGWDLYVPIMDLGFLHNQIYIPVTVADRILRTEHEASLEMFDEWRELSHDSVPEDDDEPMIWATFLLYDPRDLAAFTEAANELLPGFWGVANLSGAFHSVISSMDTILEIADLILWLTMGATIITLTLTITLLLRERRHEIGIYMALGDRKFKILSQFLTEIFLVATVGIALALFTGNILSDQISRNMFEQTMIERMNDEYSLAFDPNISNDLMLFNPGDIPLEEALEMYDTSLDTQTIAIFIGVSFIIILISTIAPIVQIVRLEPKKVLL